MDLSHGPSLRSQIKKRLNLFSCRSFSGDDLKPAAVGIIVVGGSTEGRVLLTKRPTHLTRHKGQYALPGGRLEPGETPEVAALRELEEELGLKLEKVSVLGRLDDYPTRSGFLITPVVMWGPAEAEVSPDPNEVAKVFYIPLSELNSPELPEFHPKNAGEHPILSIKLPTTQGSVFAPTAAVLYQFREVVLRGKRTRVSHFDQPQFAWK